MSHRIAGHSVRDFPRRHPAQRLGHPARTQPAKKPYFDVIVANPPFSYRWDVTDALGDNVRFKNHDLAPKSAADFAFLKKYGIDYDER